MHQMVTSLGVLYYIDDSAYWSIFEELGKLIFGYTWKSIPCKLPRIFTLVHVHYNLTT